MEQQGEERVCCASSWLPDSSAHDESMHDNDSRSGARLALSARGLVRAAGPCGRFFRASMHFLGLPPCHAWLLPMDLTSAFPACSARTASKQPFSIFV